LSVSGDLLNENEVLEWLIEQKNSATIEEVTDEILDDLIAEHEYVVVYFCKSFCFMICLVVIHTRIYFNKSSVLG